jgi:hypothetical protein
MSDKQHIGYFFLRYFSRQVLENYGDEFGPVIDLNTRCFQDIGQAVSAFKAGELKLGLFLPIYNTVMGRIDETNNAVTRPDFNFWIARDYFARNSLNTEFAVPDTFTRYWHIVPVSEKKRYIPPYDAHDIEADHNVFMTTMVVRSRLDFTRHDPLKIKTASSIVSDSNFCIAHAENIANGTCYPDTLIDVTAANSGIRDGRNAHVKNGAFNCLLHDLRQSFYNVEIKGCYKPYPRPALPRSAHHLIR